MPPAATFAALVLALVAAGAGPRLASGPGADAAAPRTAPGGDRPGGALESVLERLAAGAPLSTREAMELRRQPDAIPALIRGLQGKDDTTRREGLKLLVDLGRVLVPPEGAFPERPGPIVGSPAVVARLVEALGDPDREVRRIACGALARLVPGALVEEHAAAVVRSLERHPTTDDAVVLLGKTRSPAALAALRTNPAFSGAAADDVEMARARLGDERAERAIVAAYEAAPDARAQGAQARRLGYVGSGRTVRLLARDIRTPATYVWSRAARRSLRVHLVEGLHLAFPEEPLFWRPPSRPTDDAYYERIERWLAAKVGASWRTPRPPFLYEEESPTPAPRPR